MAAIQEQTGLTRKIDAIIRFLLYVMIFWLPYSSAVIEITVSLSLVLWLVKRGCFAWRSVRSAVRWPARVRALLVALKPVDTFINGPAALFLIACLLSVFNSADPGYSLFNFFVKTLEWFVIYFLVVEVFRKKKHVSIAVGVLLFTGAATAIDAFIQYYWTGQDIFMKRALGASHRATASFKAPPGLGAFLTILIPLTATLMISYEMSIRRRMIHTICFILFLWALFLSFTRGAWLGVLAGFLFLFVMLSVFGKNLNRKAGMTILILTLTGSSLFFVVNQKNRFLANRPGTIQWRIDVWEDTLKMIKDKPLLGHGINTYMKEFQKYYRKREGIHPYSPTYAHNCYLQIVAETGIVGGLAFLWLLICLFKGALKRIKAVRDSDASTGLLALGLLAGLTAFLVHSFSDTNFYSLQLSAYLWYTTGLLVAVLKSADQTVQSSPS